MPCHYPIQGRVGGADVVTLQEGTVRIVIVGGGASGIGATGAAEQTNPDAEVVMFTAFEDVAYSPCGIPYVHGRDIDSFDDLFLQTKQFYLDRGITIHYETVVTSVDLNRQEVTTQKGQTHGFDRLVLCTGFDWVPPDVPGNQLDGLHYPKNIRKSMEFDKILDEAKTAVVIGATPLGTEMAGGLAKRGLQTHLIDSHSWILSGIADPDIVEMVEESLQELGVTLHPGTQLEAFLGDRSVTGVRTSEGELSADVVVVCDKRRPNTQLARDAGLAIGSTGGIVVDAHLRTSSPMVYAAGDIIEIPHELHNIPIQGLTGSHSYAEGKVAGTNAAGGDRRYQPVSVPWGLVAGKWSVGGAGFGENLADALGIPYVMGVGQGISRARYYPGFKPVKVKLLADPDTHALVGAQMVGGEGIKERADFLGMAIRKRITIEDLATMENVYAPPIGAVMEPIAICAQNLLADLGRKAAG
jgi:NADH oxidase (H2O2-forming)